MSKRSNIFLSLCNFLQGDNSVVNREAGQWPDPRKLVSLKLEYSATPMCLRPICQKPNTSKPGKPLSDLQPVWQRARSGVRDLRILGLRHTFAATAITSGQDLPGIGKLLGHTQVQTTARYAHLAAEPVKIAADAEAQNLR